MSRDTERPDFTGWSLAAAQDWLRPKLTTGGAACPCCMQNAQVYPERVTPSMARALAFVYGRHGRTFVHIPSTATLSQLGGRYAKLRFFGLVEEGGKRDDGGRAGQWAITVAGEAFVKGNLRVPKTLLIYNGHPLNFGRAQEMVDIHDALGGRFDLRELLGREQHEDVS